MTQRNDLCEAVSVRPYEYGLGANLTNLEYQYSKKSPVEKGAYKLDMIDDQLSAGMTALISRHLRLAPC